MAPSKIEDANVSVERYLENHHNEFLKSQTDLARDYLSPDAISHLEEFQEEHTKNHGIYTLPVEILNSIVEVSYYGLGSDSITSLLDEFAKKISSLNTLFNQLAKKFLYRYCVFTRPNSFQQFLTNIELNPKLGRYVQVLDFMEFTSIGLGRTGKMNQEIQMVTDNTILRCLHNTPFLVEFLASESIDTDLDLKILNYLFNELAFLENVDFCGSTNLKFVQAFYDLTIAKETKIHRLSFHDCTNLSPEVFAKILPYMPQLQRLDLSHTLITAKILNQFLHKDVRLTHLSVSRCTNLTTRELLEFLLHHDSINADLSLKWLNLQVDSSNVSPLNKEQLSILLKKLNAPDLQYLNLGGLPIQQVHLEIISKRFTNLQSLGLSGNQLTLKEIVDFLSQYPGDSLRVLDLTNCKSITKFTVDQSVLLDASKSLLAIEISNKLIDDLPINSVTPYSVWRPFDNNRSSRRSWIYKITDDVERNKILKNPKYNPDMNNNLIFYDLKTGQKIQNKVKPPSFLKYTSKKINCSNGFYNNPNEIFPVEFSERGIYKYYSLNK